MISESAEDEDHEKKAVPEYKSLTGISAGKLKGGLQHMLTVDPDKVRRLSLSELQLEHAIKDHASDTVYPAQNIEDLSQGHAHSLLQLRSCKRVDARSPDGGSKYASLSPFWRVLLCPQRGCDKHLWVTHGMFRANVSCGYVKKPDLMLNVGPNNSVFDRRSFHPVKTTLKVWPVLMVQAAGSFPLFS
ncbi:hypothetical protein Ancab_007408 [Ancistrocladus abbreviatus]